MVQEADRGAARARRLAGGAVVALALCGSTMIVGASSAQAGPPSDGPVLASVEPLNSRSFDGGNSITFRGSGFSTAPGGTTFLIGPDSPCDAPCVEFEDVVCFSEILCTATAPPLAVPPEQVGDCTGISPIAVVVDGQQAVLSEDFTWGNCPPGGADPDDLADTGAASPTVIGIVAACALVAGVGLLRLARRRLA